MKKKILTFLKRPAVAISISAIALVGAVSYAFVHLGARIPDQDIVASIGSVTEATSLSGTIVSLHRADLSFVSSGKVRAVYHASGERVVAGTAIAVLDTADLEASRVQAEASLLIEQSKLADMQSGIDSGYDRSVSAVRNSAIDAYVKADDAVHNYADYFYSNPTGNPEFGVIIRNGSATFSFGAKSYDQKISLNNERARIEDMLDEWQRATADETTDSISLAALSRSNLETLRSFLSEIAEVADSFYVTDLAYQPAVDSFKSKISTARSIVGTSLASLIAAQSTLPNESARAIQEAQVARAHSIVDGIDAQIAKARIIAPFTGTIARNDAHVGELAVPNVPIAAIVADGFTVEAYASEADVAKIHIGDTAGITVDAYGSEKQIDGIVVSIDKAQTVQAGVGSYKVIISLSDATLSLADGMQAAISIATGKKDNVLVVPTRAIIHRGENAFVLVKENKTTIERTVSLGVSGNGMTEILSGLSAGEHIISFGK